MTAPNRPDDATVADFHQAFAKVFGAAAGVSAERDTVRLDCIDTPVGLLIAGANDDALVQLEFCDRSSVERRLHGVRRRFTGSVVAGSNECLRELARQLSQYFAGQRREFELPLEYPGTPFQEKVWMSGDNVGFFAGSIFPILALAALVLNRRQTVFVILFLTPILLLYVMLFAGGLLHYYYRYQHPVLPFAAVFAGGGDLSNTQRILVGLDIYKRQEGNDQLGSAH